MSGIIDLPGARSGVIGSGGGIGYEEGTWDITVTGTTGSFIVDSGHLTQSYIKIGSLVTARGKVQTTSESGPNGMVKFSLPMVIADLTDAGGYATGSVYLYRTGNSAMYNPAPITVEGSSHFVVYFNLIADNGYIGFDDGETDDTFEMFFNIAYQTT